MDDSPKAYSTVVHMLCDAAEIFGDKPALIYEDRQLTYTQYLRCVAGVARKLQAFSSDQSLAGERIALICSNSMEMAIGLFAAHASGSGAEPEYAILSDEKSVVSKFS